jgi:polyvinyl alcohol dehydrogenase (cytochrome)
VKIATATCLTGLALVAAFPVACSSATNAPEPASANAEPIGLFPNPLLPPNCLSLQLGWPSFGQNVCNTRSTPLAGILNKQTVSKLAVKWTYKAAGDISATPAVVDGDVYVPDWGGMMSRINGRTGQPVWSVSVGALIGVPIPPSSPDAGPPTDTPAPIATRDTPVVTADSVIFGLGFGPLFGSTPSAYVVSIDRATGALKWATQVDAHPAAVITSSPLLENGKLYLGVSSGEESFSLIPNYPCCSFRGSVVSLDATTGKLLWKTYTIEDSAYFQSDGMTLSGFAGAAVWGSPALDRQRHSLYVDTGNNYTQPEGVMTLPAGDHIESVMALDLDTGAIKWSQRMTEGDAFVIADVYPTVQPGAGPDYDFGSGPNLYRTQMGGKPQDVVGAGQKSGIYWAVDPDSGSVLWKTPVGPGGHLGGIHWGTAVDSQQIYVGVNDELSVPYMLQGTGPQAGNTTSVGSWAALDPSTGAVKWQVVNPTMTAELGGTSVNGPLSVVNGVVFGGSMDPQGTMFAFDAATGAVLWSFASGATVYGGPAIGVDGTVYWGNGYPNKGRLLFGTPGGTLYAFRVSL